MNVIRTYRTKLLPVGWWGAVLFVASPSIATAMLVGSAAEFASRATSRYSYSRASDALFNPLLYWVLGVLGLIGVVMLLVGRETIEMERVTNDGEEKDEPLVA